MPGHGNKSDGAPAAGRSAISRRLFLGTAAVSMGGLCAARFLSPARVRRFKGSIVGGNASLGHAVRERTFPPISQSARTGIAIVGGGIGGLAAARELMRKGFHDFKVLELESKAGGNAVSGRNSISAYPWGAHYVPICGSDSHEVRQLFQELQVIAGQDANGLPIYNEDYLCADPMERLYIHGRWQEGFVPQLGVTASDQQRIDSFFQEMRRLQSVRGSDGRRAFTIPLDASSRDAQFTGLDEITMAQHMRDKGWLDCAPLRWYVNYCCRDDYGAGIESVSAWAGLHYFASRDGRASNAPGYAVVTWPEGNGWFVNQLQRGIEVKMEVSCAVWNIEPEQNEVRIDYFDQKRGQSTRLKARGVIWAAPHFIAQRVIQGLGHNAAAAVEYSPWMVANLTLDAMPKGRGMDAAWDNVIYDSSSLGYVVSTHQDLNPVPTRTVLTYYLPMDRDPPAVARQKALALRYDDWCGLIVDDLCRAHSDIAEHITQLDVWLWGHAMVRPVPGFIWGPGRQQIQRPAGNIVFAHSDLSGISIFEEAYTRGVRAADILLQQLNPGDQV